MRTVFWIILLVVVSMLLQLCTASADLPRVFQPDFGLVIAGIGFACTRKNFACLLLFFAALSSDLLGADRLGMMTLAALGSGMVLMPFRRELERAGTKGAWLSVIFLTASTHLIYLVMAVLTGMEISMGPALNVWFQLTLAGFVWSLLAAPFLMDMWAWSKMLSPDARRQWELSKQREYQKYRSKVLKKALRRS